MAAGLPIAATCVGGVPEILVSGETGLLVPPRDPAAMSEALAKLLSDAELSRRLGQSAQEEALSSYTLESYRRRLVTLYQDTLLAASREKFPVLSLP
jgi:glycosyltransferase involved in cell wall biosynthesis